MVGFDPNMLGGTGAFAAIAAMGVFFTITALVVYIYSALAMMYTAKKLKTEPAWLAWIPIANVYLLSKMAKKHWWPILLLIAFIIPVLNIIAMIVFMVYMFIWMWRICEARGRPGWWVLLTLIPVVGGIWGLILWGILAWGK